MNQYVYVCGIRFFVCDYAFLTSVINKRRKKKTIIAPLATHPVVEAQFDSKLKKIYNDMAYVVPDGYVVWAIQFLYRITSQERIYGPELLIKTCKACEESHTTIFLCGNNCDVLRKKLRRLFPHLEIAGAFDLQQQKIDIASINAIQNAIEKTKASIVLIGIGSPSQHILASRLNVDKTIVCVGAGFNIVSGWEKQAPVWMRENGLEWAYRLIQSPKRLWKRYLIFGPLFLFFVARDRLFHPSHRPFTKESR